MNVLVLCILSRSVTDDSKTGAKYTDDYKSLVLLPESFSGDFEVPSSVETILGGENLDSSPFNRCRKKILNINFAANSNISSICKFCFSDSSVISVDMSQCSLLLSLNVSIFSSCTKLVSIKLPPNIKLIKSRAFLSTESLTSIEIPDSLEKIEDWVFGYSGIESVIITKNSNMSTLLTDAFNLAKLKSFFIPKKLTYFVGSVFAGCPIVQFRIDENNPKYKTDGLRIYTGTNNDTLVFVSSYLTDSLNIPSYVTSISGSAIRGSFSQHPVFPDTVTSIGTWVFCQCKIVDFRFPPKVTTVSTSTFFGCRYLTTVYLTDNITSIENQAFYECPKLKNIILPKNLVSIGTEVFINCDSLTELTLPASFKNISDGAIVNCYQLVVKSLSSFVIVDNNVMYTNSGATLITFFQSSSSSAVDIKIPKSCSVVGKGSFASKNIKSVTFSDNPSVIISSHAFESSSITSIEFPSGLTSIGSNAFNGCKMLTKVTFGSNTNIDRIPDYCFCDNVKLSSIRLPTTITSIGQYSFANTQLLGDISLTNTGTITIDRNAFSNSGITNGNLPSSITSIGIYAFEHSSITSFSVFCDVSQYCCSGCTRLSTLTLSGSISIIDISSFDGCYSLGSFVIPSGVTTIQEYAFRGCTSLSSVELSLNSQLKEIYGGCFIGCENLKTIKVSASDTKFKFSNGALTNYEQTQLITFLPYSDVPNYVVPTGMVSIGNYAFMGSVNLMRIMFNGINIKSIGYCAFKDCRRLILVYFSSNSISEIGTRAFEGCRGLHQCGSIVVPSDRHQLFTKIGIPSVAFALSCPDSICPSCNCRPYVSISYLTPFIILLNS